MRALSFAFVVMILLPSAALARQPVVVEMFTSQGCSSCPPADRYLSELSRTAGVIALAYHVDYWNRIGWTDPFSSPKWTARQNEYAALFKSSQVYTPQAVVAGGSHLVGSDRNAIESAIDDVKSSASAGARLDVVRTESGFRVEAATDSRRLDADQYEIIVLLVQDAVLTKILDGENEGKTLRNDRIVRRMERKSLPPSRASSTFTLPTDQSWKFKKGGVVLLVQHRESKKMVAAVEAMVR